ncbi:hypothetical protein C454_02917 [Haloferax gibbonsii ATCC 33959]|uniref:Uncharacterized protein n=1 Tax=Haloferax gibbonsii (strain ATCC 33959 / DSM 4427 / JCM 8863 / NBRC 102184 / NCIMB 2188 / Ma 2.38) TaxID=1227459 RepID=M0HL67_HALGM|nr:hypothetical protein C454_02917 [Haloferax gibbonsii ATCC 33959]
MLKRVDSGTFQPELQFQTYQAGVEAIYTHFAKDGDKRFRRTKLVLKQYLRVVLEDAVEVSDVPSWC